MGKTHSKPLVARHGRGTAWARHAMCKSAYILLLSELQFAQSSGHGYYILGIPVSRLRRKPSPTNFPLR